ncbi:DUF6146 family protein [Flavobacterium sp.]|uniref:DUF6146 family protein n=1 Tax=Flavobacterium sp. TaxID=239 RepID=UPI002639910C|nr:DUF6146 family protein [Flavobacterium sp.]
MKKVFVFLIILIGIVSCKTKSIVATENASTIKGDTVKIANAALEYEVIIIDGGFTNWLNSRALPRGHYTESFLENKNKVYVSEWNNRAMQPARYDKSLYEMPINYDNSIHYGYEVNYLIYNYMIYFQNTYKQQLNGFVPPR